MPSEQDDFNRLAARAIHLQGLIGSFLQLNPDTSSAKQIEEMVIPMLKRLHHAETSAVENDQTITLLRHDIANLKVTISTLRDRVKLFRDFVQELPLEVDIETWRDGRKELLALPAIL